MEKKFTDLGIAEPILKALDEMGFITPTEVQYRSIPEVMKGEDLIVMSKTGSGKTAAFGIPMIQKIDPDAEGPQGLILTPTRELAVQVDSDLKAMSRFMPVRTAVVYGQHSMNVEIDALKKGVSIVTGTPGRVNDHIRQGNLHTKHIRFLVLDEADRMLDMGFIDQVRRIVRTIPKERVTLLFSATMPHEVRILSREYMKHPVTIEIESDTKTVDTIHQVYHRVERDEKRTQLNRILMTERPDSCMIFCNTRIAVDRVQEFLARKGYATQALHGDIPQSKRLKTIQQFRKGDFHLLVATDVAARGIHVDDLSLVINYDVPNEKDSYVHRIGRTGRAGSGGKAITLVTGDEIMSFYEIEEHTGAIIEETPLPTEASVASVRAEAERWIRSKAQRHLEHKSPAPEVEAAEGAAPPKKKKKRKKKKPAQPLAEGAAPEASAASKPQGGPPRQRPEQERRDGRPAGKPHGHERHRTEPPAHRPADREHPSAIPGKRHETDRPAAEGAGRPRPPRRETADGAPKPAQTVPQTQRTTPEPTLLGRLKRLIFGSKE